MVERDPEETTMKLGQVVALAFVLQLALVADANAYLDPGTGSFIFQTIIAIVVGSAFALKTYWQRIKARFGGKSATPAANGSEAEKDEGDRG
jgi:hypothetical protein